MHKYDNKTIGVIPELKNLKYLRGISTRLDKWKNQTIPCLIDYYL